MGFLKKEKDAYEPIESLIGGGDDYHVYVMSASDRLLAGLIGIGMAGRYRICFSIVWQ